MHTDGMTTVMERWLGDICFEAKREVAFSIAVKCLEYTVPVPIEQLGKKNNSMARLMTAISEDGVRNMALMEEINCLCREGHHILALSDRREHLHWMHNTFRSQQIRRRSGDDAWQNVMTLHRVLCQHWGAMVAPGASKKKSKKTTSAPKRQKPDCLDDILWRICYYMQPGGESHTPCSAAPSSCDSGLFLGGMKAHEQSRSAARRVVWGTYQIAQEVGLTDTYARSFIVQHELSNALCPPLCMCVCTGAGHI